MSDTQTDPDAPVSDPTQSPTTAFFDPMLDVAQFMSEHDRIAEWTNRVKSMPWCKGEDDCRALAFIKEAISAAKELDLSIKTIVSRDKRGLVTLLQFVYRLAARCGHEERDNIAAELNACIKDGGVRTDGVAKVCGNVPDLYYDRQKHCFWHQASDGVFQLVVKEAAAQMLSTTGLSSQLEKDGSPSEVDRHLLKVIHERGIDAALYLSGYKAGVIEGNGKKVLVVKDTQVIEPQAGKWETISAIINGLFGEEQFPTIYGILKRDYEALKTGVHVPGQANALCGPAECGKTLFINEIVIPLLGGTWARAYEYMIGRTTFNGDWAGAAVLLVDDETASADTERRRAFGARIKNIVGNPKQFIHDKGLRALGLCPFWRLWIALNDEPESLRMLPPMTENLPDKLNLFRCHPFDLPMPANSPAERKALQEAIQSEMPAFCAALLDWEMPADIRGSRFVVKTYHDPTLEVRLSELGPEAALLSLIDQLKFGGVRDFDDDPRKPWLASAAEIERCLRREADRQFERICDYVGACGQYLGRLRKSRPDRVAYCRSNTTRWWCIMPPIEDVPDEDTIEVAAQEGDTV